ncbi:M23 family metallopeptidase [Planctomonas deserti]|uniref:M23 family metallopeptidase n=1 Tax=Planctomonas deserti TaxID=2144185 RepID=UPI000D3A1781|nr:M23 family metallopeptidase [Planctomonas deserti]
MTQAHIWESTRDRAAAFRRRTVRAACAGATAVALVVGGFAAPAFADEYPSWEDVKAAQSTEAAQAALVAQIKADLAALQQEVAAATALVEKRGQEYFDAQQTFDDKTFEASELQRQADEAHAAADASKHQAGLLASQLARTAGGNLFVSGEDRADDLLYQLGAMSKLSEKTDQIYVKARQQQNTAQSLTDQANVAKEQLGALADAAQKALDESVSAQQALEAKQAEDEQHRADLEAQLTVLVQKADITEAQFAVGEQKRREAEAAAAAAAAAAASAASATVGGFSGPASPGGVVAASGWAAPMNGAHSSGFYGNRFHPIAKTWRFHAGEDMINGGTCGAPLYAAAAGTVTYSGVKGSYGNFILIDHGNGISTAYGHIMPGGLLVGNGASVAAGQNIARAGTTGGSTGCHLHFETRINGATVDPVTFMRARGVQITSSR